MPGESVLSLVAANATSDNVRFDALRTMPQLFEQKNYQQEALKWTRPRLFKSILTRPAAAGHRFLEEHDLCGLAVVCMNVLARRFVRMFQ
jgi:hypothetical protein